VFYCVMSHSMSTIIIRSKNFNFRDYFKLLDKVYFYYYFFVILIVSVKASHNM